MRGGGNEGGGGGVVVIEFDIGQRHMNIMYLCI